jgi:GR25 family glycosyltransferase involved in LPS biosynthesis
MVEENISLALILEDDAVFAPEASRRICGALAEAPADWDVLQLFHSCDEYVPITEHLVRFPSHSRMPVGSAGYLIRQAGARKMLSSGFPVCYPADSFIGRSYRWGITIYGFVPPAIMQNAIFPTQIYERTNWGIRITQSFKQGLVSVFGVIARVLRRSR